MKSSLSETLNNVQSSLNELMMLGGVQNKGKGKAISTSTSYPEDMKRKPASDATQHQQYPFVPDIDYT
jgi:hypothetical protein